jgi:hypothetical protein
MEEKPTDPQILEFYATRKLFALFTTVSRLSLSLFGYAKFTLSHNVSLKSVLMLFSHLRLDY